MSEHGDRTTTVDIAIVGSRLLRPGHGDPAEAGGHRRLRGARARRGGRRHVVGQHLPGLRLRRARRTSTRSRSRRTRTGPRPTRSQPEILAYLQRCADELRRPPHVRLGTRSTARRVGRRRPAAGRSRRPTGRSRARVLIAGRARSSEPRIPDIPGLDDFEGTTFHSARWDHDHDLTRRAGGRRSAPAPRRSSSCPRSSRRSGSCTSSSAPRRGSCRTPTAPITRRERRLYRRVPALQRLVRGGVYAGARDARARLRQATRG